MIADWGIKMSSAAPPATCRNVLRRFGRNRRASAAVEFALVAPLFFALLFAIIETALMFFASQVLETITQNGARMISTGQAQTGQVSSCQVAGVPTACTKASFKNYICSQIPALFDCTNLYVDVESYPAFSSISLSTQIDASNNFISTNMQYSPGGSGAIVVVRLFYPWQLFVTGLGYNIANLSNNQRLLVATAAFQNEPY
jgi:Flp pilus assembly protein TadG